MAVPGAPGRNDDLGTVGRDHPRRTRQRSGHRDALVQPLHVRRSRRLDAPRRRWSAHRRTRMARAPRRTAAGRSAAVGVEPARHAVRPGVVVVGARRRYAHRAGSGAAEHDRARATPGQSDEFEVGSGTHSWSVPFEPTATTSGHTPWRDLVGEQA